MADRIDISKSELNRLYWKEGLSANEIGRRHNQHHMYIIRRLDKHCIRKRTRKESQKLCNVPTPLPKLFSINKPEIGWIVGMRDSDGHLSKNQLELSVKDKDFADKYFNNSKKLGFNITKPVKRPNKNSYLWRTRICSQTLCNTIRNITFKSLNYDQKINYINAFFDAEGCVYFNKSKWQKTLSISSGNIEQLIPIQDFLNNLGIYSKIYRRTVKPSKLVSINHINFKYQYNLSISRKESIIQFSKYFIFSIKRKQIKLNQITKLYSKGGKLCK